MTHFSNNLFIAAGALADTLPPALATALNKSPEEELLFRNGRARIIASSNTCAGGWSLQYSNRSFAWRSVRSSTSEIAQPVAVTM
jgi:hypothetical protein